MGKKESKKAKHSICQHFIARNGMGIMVKIRESRNGQSIASPAGQLADDVQLNALGQKLLRHGRLWFKSEEIGFQNRILWEKRKLFLFGGEIYLQKVACHQGKILFFGNLLLFLNPPACPQLNPFVSSTTT